MQGKYPFALVLQDDPLGDLVGNMSLMASFGQSNQSKAKIRQPNENQGCPFRL